MSETIKPLNDRIVALREEAPTKTASGFYLPDTSKETSYIAKVTAIGGDVKQVRTGDRVLYKEYAATELTHGGKNYIIVREEDVLATIS